MYTKIVDLCHKEPSNKANINLDHLVTNIFNQEKKDGYAFVHSRKLPSTRYMLDVKSRKVYKNDFLIKRDFNALGPNEKFLVNKIFDNTTVLTYIVGGIGVGKTTFSNFFVKSILPKVVHQEGSNKSNCPFGIVFNFLDYELKDNFPSNKPDLARNNFRELLTERIQSELNNRKFFSTEEEILKIWEELIRNNKTSPNPAIDKIINELHEAQAREINTNNRDLVLARRLQIRKNILKGKFSLYYCASILKYLKTQYFNNHLPCFVLIIDNIDATPPDLQIEIDAIVKPFTYHSQARTIFNVRQTTYYQGSNDWYAGYENFSRLVDNVPYCGASPLQVVHQRLQDFINQGEVYNLCSNIYEKQTLDLLVVRLRYLIKFLFPNKTFKFIFQALTGHSIRKGMKLAQNLLYNTVFDLLQEENHKPELVYVSDGSTKRKLIRPHDVIKALFVGTRSTFAYDELNVIENVFQTENKKNESYLIKIRILKAVSSFKKGIPVGVLREVMQYFEYSDELLFFSLNEMLTKEKRLIWIDAGPPLFDSIEEFTKKARSKIFINSIGLGYLNKLFSNAHYIQEIMLDTSVNEFEFGSKWEYSTLKNKLELLFQFCRYVVNQDVSEMEQFKYNFFGKDADKFYKDMFGEKWLSHEIIENVSNEVEILLDSAIKNASTEAFDTLTDFKEKQIENYKERLNWILDKERGFFN